MPADGEVAGLLALMLLTEARRAARVSASGELVALDEQDRGAWDRALIAEGHALVRARLASGQAPGRYQILAAINAVHTDARDVRDTDWSQVVALYDQLVRLDPSPIVRLNRAIAVAELDGPQVALAEVDGLPLEGYHAFHATRADLLRRLGRSRGVAGGVRPGHRAGRQHRRDGVPHPPPRPAGRPVNRDRSSCLTPSLRPDIAGPGSDQVVVQLMVATVQTTDRRVRKCGREHLDMTERNGLIVAALIKIKGCAFAKVDGHLSRRPQSRSATRRHR